MLSFEAKDAQNLLSAIDLYTWRLILIKDTNQALGCFWIDFKNKNSFFLLGSHVFPLLCLT